MVRAEWANQELKKTNDYEHPNTYIIQDRPLLLVNWGCISRILPFY